MMLLFTVTTIVGPALGVNLRSQNNAASFINKVIASTGSALRLEVKIINEAVWR